MSVQENAPGDEAGSEQGRGPFGGLSPAEAGRKAQEQRRERLEQERLGIEPDSAKVVKALRLKAEKGDVPAARELREWIEHRKEEERGSLLSLLTKAQRACIEAHLKGEHVSQAQAVSAWCGESPA